jgi:hypothetical protein
LFASAQEQFEAVQRDILLIHSELTAPLAAAPSATTSSATAVVSTSSSASSSSTAPASNVSSSAAPASAASAQPATAATDDYYRFCREYSADFPLPPSPLHFVWFEQSSFAASQVRGCRNTLKLCHSTTIWRMVCALLVLLFCTQETCLISQVLGALRSIDYIGRSE